MYVWFEWVLLPFIFVRTNLLYRLGSNSIRVFMAVAGASFFRFVTIPVFYFLFTCRLLSTCSSPFVVSGIFCCVPSICTCEYLSLHSLFFLFFVVSFCWVSLVPLTHDVMLWWMYLFFVGVFGVLTSCSWYWWVLYLPYWLLLYYLMDTLPWLLTLKFPTLSVLDLLICNVVWLVSLPDSLCHGTFMPASSGYYMYFRPGNWLPPPVWVVLSLWFNQSI